MPHGADKASSMMLRQEPSVWSWAFQPANSNSVAGWGFWLAIVGLILTLAGFWFTIQQVRKTKSASEAVKSEVARIKISLDAYDAAHEASRAQYALKSAKRNLHHKLWSEVLISYEDVRHSLLILKSSCINLSEEQVDQIDEAILYIQKLCKRIETDIQKKTETISSIKTSEVMRDHDRILVGINLTLQRGVL